jgi:hypothetical protein
MRPNFALKIHSQIYPPISNFIKISATERVLYIPAGRKCRSQNYSGNADFRAFRIQDLKQCRLQHIERPRNVARWASFPIC